MIEIIGRSVEIKKPKQFILNWLGNKYLESKQQFSDYDFSKVKTVIEPFSGGIGFSRFLYEDKGLKDINYVFYDADENLIDFYKHLQKVNIDKFVEEYNKVNDYFVKNFVLRLDDSKRIILDGKKIRKYIRDGKIKDKYVNYLVKNNFLVQTVSHREIRKDNLFWNDLIKKATFINEKIENVDFSKYNKKTTLIYLDPPYGTFRGEYRKEDIPEKMYEKMLELFTTFPCLLVHEENKKIEQLFKKYKFFQFEKVYQMAKKRKQQMVYANKKFKSLVKKKIYN